MHLHLSDLPTDKCPFFFFHGCAYSQIKAVIPGPWLTGISAITPSLLPPLRAIRNHHHMVQNGRENNVSHSTCSLRLVAYKFSKILGYSPTLYQHLYRLLISIMLFLTSKSLGHKLLGFMLCYTGKVSHFFKILLLSIIFMKDIRKPLVVCLGLVFSLAL